MELKVLGLGLKLKAHDLAELLVSHKLLRI